METVDVGLRGAGRRGVAAPARVQRMRAFLEREWFLVLIVAVFVAGAPAVSWLSSDSWFDFVYGRDILRNGLPHHVSLTALGHGRPWSDQQWLGQVAFYGLFAAGGAKLAAVAALALFAAGLVIAVVAARRRGASTLAIGAVTVLAWLYLTTWTQTEAFSHLFFVLVLVLLVAESRRRTRRVWLTLPLLALWANLHGAVVLGAGLVALLGAVELVQRLRSDAADRPGLLRALLLLVTPWFCVIATPYGLGTLDYYRSTIFNSAFHDYLGPWMPPVPFSLVGGPFFCLALVAAAAVARRRRRLTAYEIAVLAVTLAGGVEAERSIMWFGLAAIVLLPALVELETERRWRDPRPAFRLAAVGLALGVALVTRTEALARPESYYQREFPRPAATAVARYLALHPRASIFATDQFGDWLAYTHPELRGRIAYDADWEQLTQSQVRQVVFFLRKQSPDWERVALGFRLIMIAPRQQPWLVETFERRPDVRVFYRDRYAVVFERLSPAGVTRR